jgi:hypothetical protein
LNQQSLLSAFGGDQCSDSDTIAESDEINGLLLLLQLLLSFPLCCHSA